VRVRKVSIKTRSWRRTGGARGREELDEAEEAVAEEETVEVIDKRGKKPVRGKAAKK
jgi:hypothetical protein